MTGAGLLHHLFEDAVRRSPDRPAIEVPPSSRRPERQLVSYQELKRQSDGLAHALRTFVTHEDSIVAVLLPRASEHLYLSQLAILKAGGAFTCIDPLFPDAQVRSILDDAQPVVILTDEAGLARVRHLPARAPVVDVAEWTAQWRGVAAPLPEPAWLSPDSLAYLIYTSGTTGVPKGVMIEHRSIVNLVRGDLETLGVRPSDRVVQGSSPAYDSSIEETWFALAAGATLVAMDDEVARLGPDLVPWLRRERITMFCPAPTLLRATGCVHPQTELPELRLLHPGGEALSQDVADTWAPGRRLVNDYGPTEATVTALRGVVEAGRPVSIGRPVPGMQAWVLDEHLEEVPTGERGELCLGGIGLARGYRNEPELTAAKFPVHPRLGRIYRTGDLASRDARGNFHCHGRIDAQVKIRGYRIELEAIEARLVACGGIREAACAVQGAGTQTHLVAFVVPVDHALRLGLVVLLLLTPAFYFGGLLIYAVVTVSMAVLAKRLLIGRYRPLRAPVWGSFYVRNWIVQRCVRLVPWRLLEATVFQQLALRAMGARIGQRVHLHRGVNLTLGGWDLLDIGDDVAIGQDAMLQLATLEDGEIIVGRVVIDQGAMLDVRSGVGANTRVGSNATLTAWSFLSPGGHIPAGEQWDGVPAQSAGASANRPVDVDRTHDLSPGTHGAALILVRIGVGLVTAMPLQGVALACAWAAGLSDEGVAAWFLHPSGDVRVVLVDALAVMGVVPLALLFQLLTMRLLGRVRPGAISRWNPAYLRVRLKTEILESAGRWLCGTLLWPIWLRGAGMTIGRGCEISTIIDTIPELVTIGDETFFADGVYLGGPRVSRGTVTLAAILLDGNVFLGNHTVVVGGQRIPSDVLVGVCTVADSSTIRRGTSWFGHPPFELPRREVVAYDRALTHEPSWPRYVNRVAWEMLRFAIPLVPVCVAVAWLWLLTIAEAEMSLPVLILGAIPVFEFGALALPTLFVLALKWILLGRVRPGVHPLWSCWCSRWDFLYVAWDFCASAPLSAVEGTLFLNGYLRAMGMRIGRHVVLGQSFVHVVDPDMLEFEHGSTVTCLLQAHTFEDRVLKIDRIRVGREATVGAAALLLYGADVGARTHVAPHSVVMKRERLLPDRSYAGCPTRPVDDRFAQADRPAELVAAGGADGVHLDGARRRSPWL